jgi:hypothetical protein
MVQLLSKLLRTNRETNKAWEMFISANGDLAYFSDLGSTSSASRKRIERVLHHIHAAFDEMKGCYEKLLDIRDECEKLEHALEVRLMVEANKNTELTILYICPVVVVSTFFTIPAPSISFHKNVWSFAVGVLLVTAVLYLLRLLIGGRLSQKAWWERLAIRARGVSQGERTNIVQNASGTRVIRRRAMHPAVTSSKFQ